MRVTLFIILILLIVVLVILAVKQRPQSETSVEAPSTEHVYATWDTMELDKCVAAWMIVRFIDADAKFVFYPQGAEIEHGIPFDIPGSAWSRKHRKCTSDCILESIGVNDPAVEKIVAIAHHTELNYWQLDQLPEARKCFDEIQEIFDTTPDRLQCLRRTSVYFDDMYDGLQPNSATTTETRQ